ncbi:MAG: phosphoribosylamine--glycine ligase [Oligoflexia bacterium]|nr:phosphoribosylamine--glycine ligase [Oligoflexia bacterium]
MSGAPSTVLIVGAGGREHALAWRLARSPRVGHLILAPGNVGMPREWERWETGLSRKEEFAALAERAREAGVSLAVIGPDNPLAEGIVDVFTEADLPTVGPTAAAARIEASKAFAKEVMLAAGVPTARHFIAKSREEALGILRALDWSRGGWVLKSDGLALGKGVCVCGTLAEATGALEGLPGGEFVIEERLFGEELSWMAFCDGERCALLEPARDHKRLLDGDHGPNTGGMGAFSPVPGVPASWAERMRREVFLPTLRELARRGAPFRGVLYAGLMVDFARDRFWVLEFNARFGDPEAQVLLPRIEERPMLGILEWFEAVARGDLSGLPDSVPFERAAALAVVAAAAGYPEAPLKGARIAGLHGSERATGGSEGIFCAGVGGLGEAPIVNGGRVLAAFGRGADLAQARERAYARLAKIRFEGMQYRKDIGGGAP